MKEIPGKGNIYTDESGKTWREGPDKNGHSTSPIEFNSILKGSNI